MKISKLVCIAVGIGLFSQAGVAFDVRSLGSDCTNKQGQKNSINSAEVRVDGGDTGSFVRESLKQNQLKAVQSCVLIPSSPTAAQSEEMFALNQYTGKPNQSPYLYLGINIDKKMYEAGLFYESVHADGKRPGYRLFTSGFFGKRIQYYRQYTFKPGDKVCMKLERYKNSGRLDFKVVVPGSTREGVPLKSEVVITEYQAPMMPQKVEFKRVSGMAVRSQDYGANYGSNGGMNARRYGQLIRDHVYAAFIWTDFKYFEMNGSMKVAGLGDLSQDDPSATMCRKSTVWPSQGFSITPVGSTGSMLVEMVPQNRASYSTLLTDEVNQFLVQKRTSGGQANTKPYDNSKDNSVVATSSPSVVKTTPSKEVEVNSSQTYGDGFSGRDEERDYDDATDYSGGMKPDVNYEPYIPDGSNSTVYPKTSSSSPDEKVEYEQCCSGGSCRKVIKTNNIWRGILNDSLYQKICYNFFE